MSVRVTLRDFDGHGYCLSGIKVFFDRYGLTLRQVHRGEVTTDDLRAIGDALLDPVIKAAEDRARGR